MAENKTRKSKLSVKKFLASVGGDRLDDCRQLVTIMQEITGQAPKMWGTTIVGFGEYHYRYESGREGDWFETGFSPRKQNLTLYVMTGFEKHSALMKKLGPHKTGKSCLYVKNLQSIHLPTLKQLIQRGVAQVRKNQGGKLC